MNIKITAICKDGNYKLEFDDIPLGLKIKKEGKRTKYYALRAIKDVKLSRSFSVKLNRQIDAFQKRNNNESQVKQ